ncbi:pyridoxal-dependent decarboxylase domain-containing protein [Biscogniauxia sp. FL1348]|nr:pyridoxal-dependent decarboxylase domain-containing protein [Biscogniauxia sp. FL1348]
MSSKGVVWNTKPTYEDVSHQIISSYFIGPQAENLQYFKDNINIILEEHEKARVNYFPEDGRFVDEQTQQTPAFQASVQKLKNAVRVASNMLGKHSIPFWSPRYQAHMCTDLSMASLLGYFMTMLYNPNNVAIEASPLSTVAEIEVGEQLCDLFGYSINSKDEDTPTGWGHVTCDGTVANIESMWVARNLKFYPLSLRKAFEEGEALYFLSPKFYVENCQGESKLFTSLSTWELLNMNPTNILDIPDRLLQEHGISNDFLTKVMNKFTIQSTGKDTLEKDYNITKPCQYMVANTRHYSWPKSGALCGLGSDNIVGIPVDYDARLDLVELEKKLEQCLEDQQAVFAVVAIIGSTEEGAVDPLTKILAMRKQFQARGLSFLVHADAAWGGYFCSMLPEDYRRRDPINMPIGRGPKDGFVPDASLRDQTQEDLYALRFADSITVDPHKAGYIPYPAGGLCYRDGRMRFLVTWTSPYLSRGSVTSIGIYGVEGSKPGASAVSAWLSNMTIGLGQEGYGKLLGEVTWTCSRLSAEWAALTDSESPFICVPFNMLPSERSPDTTPEKVEAEKLRIRQDIVLKTNATIVAEDESRPEDQKVMKLLRALGSDLNINAFSLNFRFEDGTLNDDVEEANYLMQRVVETFSVDSPHDDPTKIPLYLTSTEFSDDLYGSCKAKFMERLGLDQSTQDLMVLRNVVMSPFPTDGNFTNTLAEIFYDVVKRETEIVRKRNEIAPDTYKFLMQGTEQVYLIHLPLFHVAKHRQQLIVSVVLDPVSMEEYITLKKSNPNEPLILATQDKVLMQDIVNDRGTFQAQIMTKESMIILQDVEVTLTDVVVSRPLNSKWRLKDYPASFMPFYLYGTSQEVNIDHVIVRAPNTQLSAGRCKLEFYNEVPDTIWEKPLVLLLEDVYEAPMQPFPPNSEIGSNNGAVTAPEHFYPKPKVGSNDSSMDSSRNGTRDDGYVYGNFVAHEDDHSGEPHRSARVVSSMTRSGQKRDSGFFFRPGATFNVGVWEDNARDDPTPDFTNLGPLVGHGKLTLGKSVYADSEGMNYDPYAKEEKMPKWRREFDRIGGELN